MMLKHLIGIKVLPTGTEKPWPGKKKKCLKLHLMMKESVDEPIEETYTRGAVTRP